jgi:carboxyl-terminal processing protease
MVFPSLFLLLLGLAPAQGAEGEKTGAKPAPPNPEVLARRLWAVTELVLNTHIDPPARQEMLLGGVKALLKATATVQAQGLSRRVSGIQGEKEFAALLRDFWPRGKAGQGAEADKLQAAVLAGLVETVPGRPEVFPKEEVTRMQQINLNRYIGIGVQLNYDGDRKLTRIIVPIRRGEAYRAGAKVGDLILKVNGVNTHGKSLQEVVTLIRGEEGTPVTLEVQQPDGPVRVLRMKRALVPFDSVYGYRRGPKEGWLYRVDPAAPIAYLWLHTINISTVHDLRQLERRLKADGIRALVLDMRSSNGGGNVSHSIAVADCLLDGGVLWRTRDVQNQVTEYRADRECLFRGVPMVVLVNNGTRELSTQMVVAALQDNRRAVLVGDRTGAEPYIKRVVELPDGLGTTVLRTLVVERADARRRGWSVRPDHLVPMSPEQRPVLDRWLREKELPELPANVQEKLPEDPQLAKAMDILRLALKNKPEVVKTR